MRKTNHILHGVLTLGTVGVWGLGWGAIALRNWAHNESKGYNDLKLSGQPVTSSFVESVVRFSGSGSYILTPVDPDEELLSAVAHRISTQKSHPLSDLTAELGLQSESHSAPATYLPKSPLKKKPITGDVITREFVLDKELTEMFEEIGIKDPTDMQKIIDLALADTSTALPRNRLLLSFGNYAKNLIRESGLQIQ